MISGNTLTVFRYMRDHADVNRVSHVTRKELSDYLNCSLVTISRILDKLEMKGYIKRLEFTKGKPCKFKMLREEI